MKIRIENHGSIWLARPADAATREHLKENVGDEAQWFGGALVVEPRYVEGFCEMFANNGGEIE